MHFEEKWTARPDSDSDRVVPATYRNMALLRQAQETAWDSISVGQRHRPDAEMPASEVDAAEQMSDDRADDWIVQSLMRHYND